MAHSKDIPFKLPVLIIAAVLAASLSAPDRVHARMKPRLLKPVPTETVSSKYTGKLVYRNAKGAGHEYRVLVRPKLDKFLPYFANQPGLGEDDFGDIEGDTGAEAIADMLHDIVPPEMPLPTDAAPRTAFLLKRFMNWYYENRIGSVTDAQRDQLDDRAYWKYASFYKKWGGIHLIHCGFASWFATETLVRLGVPANMIVKAGGFTGNPLEMPEEKPIQWKEGLLEYAPAHYYNLVNIGDRWLVVDTVCSQNTVSFTEHAITSSPCIEGADYTHPYGVRMAPAGAALDPGMLGVPLGTKSIVLEPVEFDPF